MATLIDLLGSCAFGALAILLAVKLNIYLATTHQQSTFDVVAQQNCVQLGSIIENDFYKIGYGDKSGASIRTADTSSIKFYTDIDNNGTLDSVQYYTGAMGAGSGQINPHHKLLYRKINTKNPTAMKLGMTNFKLTYYDSAGTKTATVSKIRAIKVSLDVESDVKSEGAGGQDVVYNVVHWQQFIVPKSFHF